MPIISSSYTSTVQANGTLNVVITLVDQDGVSYPRQYPALPADFDIPAKVAREIADMNEQFAQSEFENLVGL